MHSHSSRLGSVSSTTKLEEYLLYRKAELDVRMLDHAMGKDKEKPVNDIIQMIEVLCTTSPSDLIALKELYKTEGEWKVRGISLRM